MRDHSLLLFLAAVVPSITLSWENSQYRAEKCPSFCHFLYFTTGRIEQWSVWGGDHNVYACLELRVVLQLLVAIYLERYELTNCNHHDRNKKQQVGRHISVTPWETVKTNEPIFHFCVHQKNKKTKKNACEKGSRVHSLGRSGWTQSYALGNKKYTWPSMQPVYQAVAKSFMCPACWHRMTQIFVCVFQGE